MTLTRFVTKSAFRNKRRSVLTVVSITFSLVLLTLMMTVWHSWYIDKGSTEAAQRLITRHRVSLTQSLPEYYREKMRTVPGVVAVAPTQWFGGLYKDEKPENFFAQFGTDPNEIFKSRRISKFPTINWLPGRRIRQAQWSTANWPRSLVWKIGDRIIIKGTIFPVNLELNIRGIFTAPQPTITVYFNLKYLQEAVAYFKGHSGTFNILADSPDDVPKVAAASMRCSAIRPNPRRRKARKHSS